MPQIDKLAFLVLVSFIRATGSDSTKSDIIPSFPDDPDTWIPREPPIPPGDAGYWPTYSRQADAVGLLFAGGSEFPWIVDIRLVNHDQEIWSIGNLVTNHHILTTCRAMWNFVGSPWDFNDDRKKFSRSRIPEATVNFCGHYLWESYDQQEGRILLKNQEDRESSGTRAVKRITLHPKCSRDSFEYDVSVVEINIGIPPKIPKISYMPIPEHPLTGQIADPDFSVMEENRWVCYIASFGKNSYNTKNNTANDFKVKYRVYFMDWDTCNQYFYRLCPKTYGFCSDSLVKYPYGKLMCFRSHAKVGAVCDHDIGAPLVCNGFVFGLVVRGVDFQYCHNLTPFPAIVRKTDYIRDYFTNLIVELDEDALSYGGSICGNSVLAIITVISLNMRQIEQFL